MNRTVMRKMQSSRKISFREFLNVSYNSLMPLMYLETLKIRNTLKNLPNNGLSPYCSNHFQLSKTTILEGLFYDIWHNGYEIHNIHGTFQKHGEFMIKSSATYNPQ